MSTVPIRRVSPGEYAPLSFAQQRLWHLNQLKPGNPAYNIKTALNLKGPLRADLLQESINRIIARHDSLRSSFDIVEGRPVQVVSRFVPMRLPVVDLQPLSDSRQREERKRLSSRFTRLRFNLKGESLFRTLLIRLGEHHHVLLVNFHHIICDGWSVGRFVNETGALYRSLIRGTEPQLPNLPAQYVDYAAWQQNLAGSGLFEDQLLYWQEKLSGAPSSIDLPTDHMRSVAGVSLGARRSLVLSQPLVELVSAESRRQGVTVFMLMLTALKVLLYRWTGQKDLVIGTVLANRGRAETEHLIGCFIEILPIRTIINEEQTATEFLQQTKETLIEGYSNQDCSLMNIVKAASASSVEDQVPLYNVALLAQNFTRDYQFGDELDVRAVAKGAVRNPELDLRFIVAPRIRRKNTSIICEYKTDLFDAVTIQQLLENYCGVLESLIQNPEARLSELRVDGNLMGQAARAKVRDKQCAISVAATFDAGPVKESVEVWMEELGVKSKIELAPCDKEFCELLDTRASFSTRDEALNVFLIRLEDWLQSPVTGDVINTKSKETMADNAQRFVLALEEAAQRSEAPYLVCFCPASGEAKRNIEDADYFEKCEKSIAERLSRQERIHTVTSAELSYYYPARDYYGPNTSGEGVTSYTAGFFASLGTMIARKFYSINRKPHRVIVLDCDGTLWRGVVDDDGPEGVRIEPGHKTLQAAMVAQQESGVSICLCNDSAETAVFKVFEERPEMLLKTEHIRAWRINQKPKSENIQSLAEELGVSLDRFILIDDDATDIEEAVAGCPDLEAYELPQEAASIEDWLKYIWALDHLK